MNESESWFRSCVLIFLQFVFPDQTSLQNPRLINPIADETCILGCLVVKIVNMLEFNMFKMKPLSFVSKSVPSKVVFISVNFPVA